ncbi:hypothetical protein IFM89_023175 [Coptis chinensis]|uniref:Cytochrome P450 n=1 Tax=Coptis chinensis TaxID=261450 RepID=A0A835HXD6_9MAGN|nr:hypothetical protein IFM89_023175 [Coptis chinensis]
MTPMYVWKAMRCLNLGWERKLRKAVRQVDEFAEDVIRKRKKELPLKFSDDRELSSDLLTVLMESKDDNKNPFSNKFLKDICVNIILAGRDTSAVALTWFFWLLYLNSTVEERIYEEICHIIGERDNLKMREATSGIVFQPEDIKRMDYLHAALSEALRLYPSLPGDYKEVRITDTMFRYTSPICVLPASG